LGQLGACDADTLRQNLQELPHKFASEIAILFHQLEKAIASDGDAFGVGHRHCLGGPGRLVDKAHFTKMIGGL